MINLQLRSYKKELLDQEDIPFEHIRQNMKELNFINTWLGGHAITINGFKQLLTKKKEYTICEIGCGGGDNLAAIVQWCNKNNIVVHCIGIDIKNECIEFAKQHPQLKNNTEWICSDYQLVQFVQKPDIIFSSLFCHHFNETELGQQLRWMQIHSTTGFFINDLQRNVIAYYAIKSLTTMFSSSYLVKNDAPLSVARGFHKNEFITLLKDVNISDFKLLWKWAFRYLLIVKHAK
jgi:SAM-dependent methyltransferase